MPDVESRERRSRVPESETLGEILERVLDTGIVIAGDIRVNLVEIELLTIQLRLVVCSVDKAEELGIDWWKDSDYVTSSPSDASEADTETSEATPRLDELNDRLARLEKNVERLADASDTRAEVSSESQDSTDEMDDT
jgi:hypothetical protein